MLELGAGVSGAQLVEIVDHQHNDSGRFGQFRYDRVDHHIAVEIGRSGLPSGISAGIRSPDRLQDGEPELLRILLVAGHRHEGDPAILARRSDHARSSDVFPLPGGAEMTVTFLSEERSNAAKRSSRRSSPFATPVMLARLPRSSRGRRITSIR